MSAAQPQSSDSWWVPRRQSREELIDQFDQPSNDLLASFQDIERFNRLFGGISPILKHLSVLLQGIHSPVAILDVATGMGGTPRSVLLWATQNNHQIKITGLDANENVVRLAQTFTPPKSDLTFVTADALCLPFGDESFDIVLCSLTLHHFDDASAAKILNEMRRVARRAIIVNDLRRSYIPAALIWMISRLLRMNRLSIHDAPLSVLRSRTMSEYRRLTELAGLSGAEVHKHPFWRATIVWRKS